MKPHLLFLVLLLTAVPLQAGSHKAGSITWKQGDHWKMNMEQWSRTDPNELGPARYVLRSLIPGKGMPSGVDTWGLAFNAAEQTPRHLTAHYSVAVAKDTGWPVRLMYSRSFKRVPQSALAVSAIGIGLPYEGLNLVGAMPMLEGGRIKPTEQVDWLEPFGNARFVTAAAKGDINSCSASNFTLPT